MVVVGACMPLPPPVAVVGDEAAATMKESRSARVLVLGGTGRVGWSAATALSKLRPDLDILIGGRNREKGKHLASKLGKRSEFVQADIHDASMLEEALNGVDLVVHAAGPFQGEDRCTVLEAAIATKTPYVDVCDDVDYSWRAKGLHEQAKASGVPAIITAGICPGVSNGLHSLPQLSFIRQGRDATQVTSLLLIVHVLYSALVTVMAAELVHAARSQKACKPERLRFSYYIAGSGGVGPTTLASSFLLLGEDAVAYNKGEEIKLKPYSGVLNTDFGKGVGKKDVYLLNLPEVKSAFKYLNVPTVSARYGSDPIFWNWGMHYFANFLPIDILRDKNMVLKLVEVIDPIVRTTDGILGECISMRVDLEYSNGQNTFGLFTHRKLSISVGYAATAFVLAILEGNTQPGVWFPEEPEGISTKARKLLLKRAALGAANFVMNKTSWMVETGRH